MTLNELIAELPRSTWLDSAAELAKYRGVVVLTKNESKLLLKELSESLKNDDVAEAAAALGGGLLLDEDQFLANLQKDGLLRASRYRYQTSTLSAVVRVITKNMHQLSTSVLNYLESVLLLLEVGQHVRAEYVGIVSWMAKEREGGIKSSLAALDFMFLKQVKGLVLGDQIHQNSRDIRFHSAEGLAEGVSALLAIYETEFGSLRQTQAGGPIAGYGDFYFNTLIWGAHIAVYREWEFEIDRLGYRLSRSGEYATLVLFHPNSDFHRARELGFIRVFQQRILKPLDWMKDTDKSFMQFAPKAVKALEDAGFIRLVETPTPRYRFEFPAEVLSSLAGVGELFGEERIALLEASRELLTPIETLLNFDIGNGLTFRSFFHASRLMQFIRSVTVEKLFSRLDIDPAIVFQSLIPVMQRDNIVGLIATVVGEKNAAFLVDLMTTDPKGHVDIQYRPLVPAEGAILLPANVFASSNVYRNPLIVNRKRLYEDGTDDPLSRFVGNLFLKGGYACKVGFEYFQADEEGEVDVLACVDDFLFAMECKNSLHPTGVHELMTSFDYVMKAVDQLSRFRRWFENTGFREQLSKKTGLAVGPTTKLVTCIVMSNRMFSGWRPGGHPVRGPYEIAQFINEGTIQMGEEKRFYWQGEKLTGEDIRRFMEDDITYASTWTAMKEFTAAYKWVGLTVNVKRLFLDAIELANQHGFAKAKAGLLGIREIIG